METTDQDEGSSASCNCSVCSELMDDLPTPTPSGQRHTPSPPVRATAEKNRDSSPPDLTPTLPPSPPPSPPPPPNGNPNLRCDRPPLEQGSEEENGHSSPSPSPLVEDKTGDCGEVSCHEDTAQEPGRPTDSPSSSVDDRLQEEGDAPSPGVTKNAASSSIYFDDGTAGMEGSKPKAAAPKRLTMAERARLEALATFGGADLGSMKVRKIDLHVELKRKAEEDKEMEGREGPPAKRSRLQTAKEEAESRFKDMPFGEGRRRYGRSGPPTLYRQRTNSARSTGTSRTQRLRPSRVELAQRAAMETFGEASLDDLPVKKRPVMSTDGSAEAPQASGRRLTRVERARLEVMESFGGTNLDTVMDSSTKKVARYLEPKKAGEDAETEQKENVSSY